MANKLASMPGQFLSLLLVVWVLSAAASGNFYNYYGRWNLPSKYGGGRSFFDDFLKCDASIDYCYEYKNASCVGPPNWVCLHNLNRAAGRNVGTVGGIKDLGFGNTRCCGGKHQSPIDIPTDAQCNTDLRTMTPFYPNASQVLTGTIENNGYDPKFFVENEKYDTPLIARNFPFTGSVYSNDEYVFSNVHVHSGRRGHGSEHFVRGKAYDGEFHMVHVHRDFYTTTDGIDLQCASQNPLGLAVIAVFLSLTEGEPNAELNKLLTDSNLKAIREYNPEEDAKCDFDEICDPDLDKLDNKNGDIGDYFGLSKLFKFFDNDDYCEDVDSSEEEEEEEEEEESDDMGDTNRTRRSTTPGKTSKRMTLGSMTTERGVEGVKKGEREGAYDSDNDSDSDKDNDSDNDSNETGDGNRKKVKCFCRRARFDEMWFDVARWLGAARGEGAKCRTEMGGENAADAESSKRCSKHMNYAGCSDGTVEDFDLKPALLLPKSKEFYHYFGSLTSPPCSEVVNWVVMKKPIKITPKQLHNLHKLESRREGVRIGKYGNTRPLQDINNRAVLSTC